MAAFAYGCPDWFGDIDKVEDESWMPVLNWWSNMRCDVGGIQRGKALRRMIFDCTGNRARADALTGDMCLRIAAQAARCETDYLDVLQVGQTGLFPLDMAGTYECGRYTLHDPWIEGPEEDPADGPSYKIEVRV